MLIMCSLFSSLWWCLSECISHCEIHSLVHCLLQNRKRERGLVWLIHLLAFPLTTCIRWHLSWARDLFCFHIMDRATLSSDMEKSFPSIAALRVENVFDGGGRPGICSWLIRHQRNVQRSIPANMLISAFAALRGSCID